MPKLPSNPYTSYILKKLHRCLLSEFVVAVSCLLLKLNVRPRMTLTCATSWDFQLFKFSAKAAGEPLTVLFKAVIDAHGLDVTFQIPVRDCVIMSSG